MHIIIIQKSIQSFDSFFNDKSYILTTLHDVKKRHRTKKKKNDIFIISN